MNSKFISSAPLRITLSGGGTDLPSFYKLYGSHFISAAISKYIWLTFFPRGHKITDRKKKDNSPDCAKLLNHSDPLVIAAFEYFSIANDFPILVQSDAPPNCGLGSSGAFLVALVNGLATLVGRKIGDLDLADIACEIEIDRANRPVGKQDPFISALGGINSFKIETNGNVKVNQLPFKQELKEYIEKNGQLIYFPLPRDAGSILEEQNRMDSDLIVTSLKTILENSLDMQIAIENKMFSRIPNLFEVHWKAKVNLSKKVVREEVLRVTEALQLINVSGVKLIGAGGGGFLFIISETLHAEIKKIASQFSLSTLPINVTQHGARITA